MFGYTFACPQWPRIPHGRHCPGLGLTGIGVITAARAVRTCLTRSSTIPHLGSVFDAVLRPVAADDETMRRGESATPRPTDVAVHRHRLQRRELSSAEAYFT